MKKKTVLGKSKIAAIKYQFNKEYTIVVLENLTVIQLSMTFPVLYGSQMFNTMFIKAHHWILFWKRLIQCTPSVYFDMIHFNIILPRFFKGSHLYGFLTKIQNTFLIPTMHVYVSPSSCSLFWSTLNFLANVILKFLKVLFKFSVTEMEKFSYNAQ